MTAVLVSVRSHLPPVSTPPLSVLKVRVWRIIYKVFIDFISVVTEPVSTTITPVNTVTSEEDPLAFLSPEEREFFRQLSLSEQEMILASLTTQRPVAQQDESGNTALINLNALAQEFLNLNFSTGNTETNMSAPSARNSEDRGELSDITTTIPAFIIESPSLHNNSNITR